MNLYKKAIRALIILACIHPAILFSSETPADASPKSRTVDRIILDGNARTRRATILKYIGIDSGDVYDSTLIKHAEERLFESGLFSFVKIHSVATDRHITLLVVVKENQYFSISTIGGAIYDKRYGDFTDRIWLQGYGTLAFKNFRGRNEQIDISASLFRIRYIGVSWYKPFIRVPCYLKLGSTIGSYPYVITEWHTRFFNSSYATLGREINKHSNISLSILGRYTKTEWKGGNGNLFQMRSETDSVLITNKDILHTISTSPDTTIPEFSRDIHQAFSFPNLGTDSLSDSIVYKWYGYSSHKINHYEHPFTELYLSFGWSTDKRDQLFNAHKGWFLSCNALTNALWPYKDINVSPDSCRYVQLNADFSFFHRGIWNSNTVGYRIRPAIRLFGRGNIYSGMYMGNEYTLRGYRSGDFGNWQYNNRLLATWEYRFPIVTLPAMRFPWLAWYDKALDNFHSRIDGAFFFDGGYLWKDLPDVKHPLNDHQYALGTGCGFRFMFPAMKRSVCAEAAFPVIGFPAYKKDRASRYQLSLYLDLPF